MREHQSTILPGHVIQTDNWQALLTANEEDDRLRDHQKNLHSFYSACNVYRKNSNEDDYDSDFQSDDISKPGTTSMFAMFFLAGLQRGIFGAGKGVVQ